MKTGNNWRPMRVAEWLGDGMSASELRRGAYHHPFWGVVRPVTGEPSQPTGRILDAAALVRGGGALGGWASAYRHGVRYLDGRDRFGQQQPVLLHTVPGHQVRKRPGIEPTRCRLLPGEIEWLDGDAVTVLERALYDEMRLAPSLTEAVVILDMGVSRLTGNVHTSLEAVGRLVDRHVKTRGIAQARNALVCASERSCSPLETRTRLVVRDALPLVEWRVNRPCSTSTGVCSASPT